MRLSSHRPKKTYYVSFALTVVNIDAKITTMYARHLKLLNHSFFLLGCRSTGKTTWIRQVLPDAKRYDLLENRQYLDFTRDPDLLFKQVSAMDKGSWVVIDEIQRVPNILNSVHRIINEYGGEYKFVLSGSSARKIKKQNANLLAGKAATRNFFPLVGHELDYTFEVDDLLMHGTLPQVCSSPEMAIDILESYVVTYLEQEIQQEAATRDLDAFNRFIEIAGIMNGSVLNMSSIARDAGISRTTVERYFSILIDTLIGYFLPPWNPKLKVKEIKSPKFYLFDCGVVRALTNQLREPLNPFTKGFYLENIILNELRAWMSYQNTGGTLSYWSVDTKDRSKEIDFIWSRGKNNIAFEVKSSIRWKKEYGKYLREFLEIDKLNAAYGIYLGDDDLIDDGIHILSLKSFMKKLFSGELIY
jgi:predicted AAA+ superfamily ATPase